MRVAIFTMLLVAGEVGSAPPRKVLLSDPGRHHQDLEVANVGDGLPSQVQGAFEEPGLGAAKQPNITTTRRLGKHELGRARRATCKESRILSATAAGRYIDLTAGSTVAGNGKRVSGAGL